MHTIQYIPLASPVYMDLTEHTTAGVKEECAQWIEYTCVCVYTCGGVYKSGIYRQFSGNALLYMASTHMLTKKWRVLLKSNFYCFQF